MAKLHMWTSTPLKYATTIDATNNVLDITLNGATSNLLLDEVGYMTDVIRHDSRLVDEINEWFITLGVNVECKLGVIAQGNIKETYITFSYEDTDTFSYDGTFKSVVGEVQTFPDPIIPQI